jgi:hypothetical protein
LHAPVHGASRRSLQHLHPVRARTQRCASVAAFASLLRQLGSSSLARAPRRAMATASNASAVTQQAAKETLDSARPLRPLAARSRRLPSKPRHLIAAV